MLAERGTRGKCKGIAHIYDMLALITLFVVWACAARNKADIDAVDIPGRAGNFDGFLGDVVGTMAGSIDNYHSYPFFQLR